MEVNETGSVIFLEDTQPLNSALSTRMIFEFSLSDNTFEKKKALIVSISEVSKILTFILSFSCLYSTDTF